MGLSKLRRSTGDDQHRPAAHQAVLVAPAPEPPAVVATPPSREIRSLCCEGSCSPGLHGFNMGMSRAARGGGISSEGLRGAESQALRTTPHYFVRTTQYGPTVYQTWACTVCGNERIYGAEEG